MENIEMNLPEYVCHKRVRAAKITQITESSNGWWLVFGELAKEGEFFGQLVQPTWLMRHSPEVGGYFVRYSDGYTSYSPGKAFEDGYTAVKP